VPSKQRRLASRRVRPALAAALELLGAAAFITNCEGEIEEANSIGKRDLTSHDASTRVAVRAAVRAGTDRRWLVTPTTRRSVIDGYLVVERASVELLHAQTKIHNATLRWGLSARQADVFALVCEGATNRAIAARLGIAERTAELHLTAVIAKADVESRAALIVATLSGSI